MKRVLLGLIITLLSTSLAEANCHQVFAKDPFEKEISRLEFDRRIEGLASRIRNPAHGFFGPRSMFWKVWREEVLGLRSLSSIVLQISHPSIAHAISQRPEGIQQPIKRYEATTVVLGNLIFGDLQTALSTAQRMHKMHSHFEGKTNESGRYKANNPKLTYWVWATLIEGSLQAYQRFVSPLSKTEIRQYYEESKILVQLSGIPIEAIPSNYTQFQKYYKDQVNNLIVTENAKGIFEYLVSREGMGQFIDKKLSSALRPLGMHYAPSIAAAMLPKTIANQFSIESTAGLDMTLSNLRHFVAIAPKKWRYKKYYKDALERIETPLE